MCFFFYIFTNTVYLFNLFLQADCEAGLQKQLQERSGG